jgi:hypothetical protein
MESLNSELYSVNYLNIKSVMCCAIKDDNIDNQLYIRPRRWRGLI